MARKARESDDGDEIPLVTLAMATQAERVAVIRSMKREATGLSKRSHRRFVMLIEKLASEHFSDGRETQARVGIIAAALHCDRRTVHRCLRDAEKLGVVTSTDRTGNVGQRIGSLRVLDWDRIFALAGRNPHRSTAAKPSPELSHPSDNCHTPVTTVTPSNPDRTYRDKRSGSPDRKNSGSIRTTHRVDASTIAQPVANLYRRLSYDGAEGWVFWSAIAAVHVGKLAAGDVGRTVDAITATGRRVGPGYFRVVLGKKAGMDPEQLNATLKSVAITWGDQPPGQRPAATEPSQATLQRIPSEPSTRQRQTEITRQLKALA